MGEKDETKGENKPADAQKKPENGPITVVLKLDLHCEGCAKKIKKSLRQFEGVESVKADTAGNKLTVVGKVDPTRVKERVEFKTKKKTEILSPQPKKDVAGAGAGEEKKKETPPENKPDEKKPEEKKPEKPKSSTVVLKIPLHCEGCTNKIKRTISKLDEVESVTADSGKDLVTVKGTMNMKELLPQLKEKFKRKVDIVPPKMEDKKADGGGGDGDKKEKEGGGGGDKKEKEGGGGGEEKATGGDNAKAAGDGGGGGDDNKNKGIEVVKKLEYQGQNPYTYTYTMPMYNPNYYNQDYGAASSSSNGYVYQGYNHMEYSHAPSPPPMYFNDPRAYQPGGTEMFSDDNPNACSLM